jgi:hypothetical protein
VTWEFEHAVEVNAKRQAAWEFWTNVQNWAVIDTAIEGVELQGPFQEGTLGTTKQRGFDPVHWRIVEAREGESAVIEVVTPDAVAHFAWHFKALSEGKTQMRQRITLDGPGAERIGASLGAEFTQGVRTTMEKLRGAIEQASGI